CRTRRISRRGGTHPRRPSDLPPSLATHGPTTSWLGFPPHPRPPSPTLRLPPPQARTPPPARSQEARLAQPTLDCRPRRPPDPRALRHLLPPRARSQDPQAAPRLDQPEAQTPRPRAQRQGG